MRLYTIVKNDIREVERFVNEHRIQKEEIVDIFQNNDHEYVLLYYGE
jgi:hypothetical protein